VGDGERASLWREGLLATLLYASLTAVLAYPLTVYPGSRVIPLGADTHYYLWALGWDVHALVTQPLSIFDANIFYPYRHTLAYSENIIGSAVIAAPFIWLTGNLLLGLNAVSLISLVLCGVGTYVLARRLRLSVPAAIVAGIVFAFAPPRFFRIAQLHLATVQWMPFCLASLHAYFDHGQKRDLRWACAFFTAQALTSGHGAVFTALAVGGLVTWRIIRGEPWRWATRLTDLGIPGVLLLALGGLVFLPYDLVKHDIGLERSIDESYTFAPNAISFIASISHVHLFVLSFFTNMSIVDHAKALLFPGYGTLALAVAALWPHRAWVRGWLRAEWIGYAGLTAVSLWLVLGPSFGLYALLYRLPGFSLIRVPSRYMILTTLALAIVAAVGFERVTRRVTPAVKRRLAVVVSACLVIECAAFPLATDEQRFEIPVVNQWLATRPPPFVVAELPVTDRQQSYYMLYSTAHWQKTIHGYSSLVPPLNAELYAALRQFPDDESLGRLADFGVRYVVIHPAFYEPGEWDRVRRQLAGLQMWLTLEHEAPDGMVYSLTTAR
jgi:hypothetical protein